MDPIFELAIDLLPRGSGKPRKTLGRQFRTAILSGRLRPGTLLPASRQLAVTMGEG